jgi:hypothetical protein
MTDYHRSLQEKIVISKAGLPNSAKSKQSKKESKPQKETKEQSKNILDLPDSFKSYFSNWIQTYDRKGIKINENNGDGEGGWENADEKEWDEGRVGEDEHTDSEASDEDFDGKEIKEIQGLISSTLENFENLSGGKAVKLKSKKRKKNNKIQSANIKNKTSILSTLPPPPPSKPRETILSAALSSNRTKFRIRPKNPPISSIPPAPLFPLPPTISLSPSYLPLKIVPQFPCQPSNIPPRSSSAIPSSSQQANIQPISTMTQESSVIISSAVQIPPNSGAPPSMKIVDLSVGAQGNGSGLVFERNLQYLMKKMTENKGKAKNQLPYKSYQKNNEITRKELVLNLEEEERRKEAKEGESRKRGRSIPYAFYSMNKHKNRRMKENV